MRKELGAAEREVATLERQRDELAEALAAAGADHEALASAGKELADVEAELAAAEARWLVLAEEAEGFSTT